LTRREPIVVEEHYDFDEPLCDVDEPGCEIE